MSIAPRVTVLMSVFNGEPFVGAAVDSVLAQTFPDFEFIIVDDGSTDDTAALLAGYDDPRLRLVKSERNLGLTRSLNAGLKLARGQFIARQDADDVSYPDRLARQVTRMDRSPELGLLGTAYDVIGPQNQRLDTVRPPSGNSRLQEQLLIANHFCHGSVMIRRECLIDAGDYQDLPVAQDYDLWLRIAEQAAIDILDLPLYRYRFHGRAISVNKLEEQLTLAHRARDRALARRGLRAAAPPSASGYGRQLLQATLRHAYLAYRIPDEPAAQASAARAYAIAVEYGLTAELAAQIRAHAEELARETGEPVAALGFIRTVCGSDAEYGLRNERRLTAGHHVDEAFRSLARGDQSRLRGHVLAALRREPAWLRNAGMRSMIVAALFGPEAHRALRQLRRDS